MSFTAIVKLISELIDIFKKFRLWSKDNTYKKEKKKREELLDIIKNSKDKKEKMKAMKELGE